MSTQAMKIDRVRQGERIKSSIGMMMVLVSFGMLFATLFLGYIVHRSTSESWPPMGMERVDLFLPTLSTIVILVSSLFYFLAEKAFYKNDLTKFRLFIILTFVAGSIFMGAQFYFWSTLTELGFVVETGIFASLVYTFTWLHAAHIVGGLISIPFALTALTDGAIDLAKENRVINVGKFWHFLGVVWVIIFFGLFVF